MCHTHRRAYTNALRKAADVRKAAEVTTGVGTEAEDAPKVVDEVAADSESPATPSRKSRKLAACETDDEAQPDD